MATAAAVSLLITSATTVAGLQQQRKARRATQRADAKREEQAKLSRRAERQRALAEAARRKAQIQAQSAAGLGVGAQATGVDQASSSLTTQLGANIALSDRLQSLEDERTSELQTANNAISRAGTIQALGNLGTAAVSAAQTKPKK